MLALDDLIGAKLGCFDTGRRIGRASHDVDIRLDLTCEFRGTEHSLLVGNRQNQQGRFLDTRLPKRLFVADVAQNGFLAEAPLHLDGLGVLVDDAIIYVENVYRRVRENAAQPPDQRKPFMQVVARASSEIRAPIAMATFIVIVVFIPLFFLSGVEGRMLKPLGFAYAISILASLLVAVTVTPALSSYLLRNTEKLKHHGDSWLVRKLNWPR